MLRVSLLPRLKKKKKRFQAVVEISLLEFNERKLTSEMNSLSGNYIVSPPLESQNQVKEMSVTKFNDLKKKYFSKVNISSVSLRNIYS